MSLALASALRCACGAAIEEHEGDRCAFCRRDERGDDALLSHDDRGWIDGYDLVKRTPWGKWVKVERRAPCGCGCGMVAAPRVEEPEPVERPAYMTSRRMAPPAPRLTSLDDLLVDLAGELER